MRTPVLKRKKKRNVFIFPLLFCSLLSSCSTLKQSSLEKSQQNSKLKPVVKEESFGTDGHYKMALILDRILSEGRPVSFAILSTFDSERKATPFEKKRLLDYYTNSAMQSFLETFKDVKNFTLVERGDLDTILKEKHFNMTGITGSNVKELGTIIGVSHLMSYNIYFGNDEGDFIGKLWDVETGQVLGSYNCRVKPNVNRMYCE